MKKIVKKVVGCFLLAFMLFTITGNAMTLANNYGDEDFTFNFYGVEVRTIGREKMDTSKMYMKCTDITENRTYTGYAMGYRTPYGTDAKDCSRGFGYVFQKGVYHYMTNWVKEDGYYYGAIKAVPNYTVNFTATGVWSPDNVNKY